MKKNYKTINRFFSLFFLTSLAILPFNLLVGQTTTIVGSNTVVTYSTSTGSPFSWNCPVGVTSVQVECWGAGGGSGGTSTNTARAGGGGAGGGYVMNTAISVISGTNYTLAIGAGGTAGGSGASGAIAGTGGNSTATFGSTILTATGGGGGGNATSTSVPANCGTAGAGSSSSNVGYSDSYNFAGGNGAPGVAGSRSGGGGGAAGSNGVGGAASTADATGGIAGTGGANGSAGISTGNAVAGIAPGGGASGGYGSSKTGAAGGAGQITITYLTPGTTAVSSLTNSVNAYVLNGKLVLSDGDVYNSIGKKIASVTQKTELSLKSGIYFVKSNKSIQKVIL